MATNPFFSGRIPQALYNAIEGYRQQTGESKTDILVKALSSYIKHPLEEPAPANSLRLEALENRVSQLERWIITLQLQAEKPGEKVEIIPQGQMSLDDIQPLEETLPNDRDIQSTDNIVIDADNEKDNSSSPNSNSVIDSDNGTDNKSESLTWSNQEVASFVVRSNNTIRSRHNLNKVFEEKGRHFEPIRLQGRPAWKVTVLKQ